MFDHRSYLGWVTDLASRPHPTACWPAITLEDWLLEDYATTFAAMERIGLNEIVVWGLFTAVAWPLDVESAVGEQRAVRIRRLIDLAHGHDIKVLAGLGVYSWGFDQIIAAHPHLVRGNPRVMCSANPEAWAWQQRIVDYVFSWDLDGISMQSADHGRCPCDNCAHLSDVAYHAALNARTAGYVKRRWPKKLVGVNSWGMTFEHPADVPHLVDLSHHVDYIIDAHDTARRSGEAHKRWLIDSVRCAWGTIGGWSVEPPLHWTRDRWFLPCLASAASHIYELAASGGGACELFFRITANPGDEISLLTCGRLLNDPDGNWRRCLMASVREVYEPADDATAEAVADLFLQAEAAYFDNAHEMTRVGTISMEPLVSDHAGEPVYLIDHMDSAALDRYETALREVQADALRLVDAVAAPERVRKIARCIDGVMRDIDRARAAMSRKGGEPATVEPSPLSIG
ncbi:MAG: hypothetical protein ACRDJW_21355 [Thermomicrobiales bacterium]